MTNKAKSRGDESSVAHSRCFFDIEFNKNTVGRIVMELYNDLCPKTANNFRSLCTGKNINLSKVFKR